VITSAELVADATYLEFESVDGANFSQAKVISVDYEANLALLGPVAEEDEGGNLLFKNTVPLEISNAAKVGETLEILQVEDNGQAILTAGNLQSVDVVSNFLPDQQFLTYLVKASMQSGASSYSLPVLQNGKLSGILVSYNAKDQICDITSTDMIARFIKASSDGEYKGFPSLGVAISRTEDASFRQWLKLTDDQGGVYVSNVRKKSAAEAAGVKKGDVLLSIDGHLIDRRGYYQHSIYGSLFWGHLIRGEKFVGDVVTLSLLREGKPLEIKATLTSEGENPRLVPSYTFGKAPNFLIKGGFVFQELTRPLLESYGENWESRAPLSFLDALENPQKFEDKMDRVIFLSGAIPTPATVGYESLRNLIVKKVNGKEIRNMKGLIDAFDANTGDLDSIEFIEEDFTIYLDDALATNIDAQLLKRGINRLSRAE
jgi:S1-C subfamily serine protease